jgi:hypothetical protein
MNGSDNPLRVQSNHRSRWWKAAPLALIAALYILPLAGSAIATNPNELGRIELAASLAFFARLDLREVVGIYGLSEDVSIRDGNIYSDKAPGLSVAAVPAVWIVGPALPRAEHPDLPAYWPLRHSLTLLLVALPAFGLALLVGSAVPDLEPNARIAVITLTALTTPLWTYGTVFFGHAPAALLITVAWFLLLGFPGRSNPQSARRAVVGGVVAGFAGATEYPTVLLIAVIFVTLVVRRTPLPIVLWAAVGVCVGALPAMVYHHLAFGAPWLTGYGLKAHSDFQAIHGRGLFGVSLPTLGGLWGILFSARRGLFFYCPLLLLAPLGLRYLVRDRGWRDAGPILGASMVYLLFAAGFVDWQAGWCAAARHLVPVVPFVIIAALFAAVRLAKDRLGAVVVVVLIAISGANAVLTVVLTPFFPPQFGAPLAQLVLPSLVEGAGFSNLLTEYFSVAPAVVAVLTIAVSSAALIWASIALIRRPRWWLPGVYVVSLGAIWFTYTWQGANPSIETELMRAQVLRRLDHSATVDRPADSLPSVGPNAAE